MFDIAIEWVYKNYPLLFVILLVIVVTVYVTKKIINLNSRFSHVEKTCNSTIPDLEAKIDTGVNLSETIISKIDNQSQAVIETNAKFGVVAKNIHTLVTFLTTKHTDLQSGLFQSYSPIQLTNMGIDVLTKCGGKKYVDDNLNNLIANMETQEFKSALDVQNYATSLIIAEFDSDPFIHIRNYVFQNPVYRPEGDGKEIGINASTIYQLLGIYLRDKYFEKHPALKDVE